MNIRYEIIKGTSWNAVGRYSHYIFQFIVSMILARLLTPSDFGIVSMVVVYTGFVDLLSEFGLSATVIQKRYLDHNGLSTVFWLSFFIALVLIAISIILSPLIEEFYKFPGLSNIVRVMSVNLFLSGVAVVLKGRLQRRLAFKELAKIEISSAFLSGLLGITFAFIGLGYWALVLQGISFRFFVLIGSYWYERWIPLLKIQFDVLLDVVNFSGNVLGFRSINYWARNADNLLIGRFMGAAQLGFYNQAYSLMMLPIRIITETITPTLQPVFSSIQDEPRKMAHEYLKIIELIALVSFPGGVFLVFFAGPLINVLWGDQWIASIPVFEVLAFLTMVQPVISTSGSVFLARNKSNTLFRLGIVNSLIMITGIVIGLPFGIVGVAKGYAITYFFLVFPITLYFLSRALDEKLRIMLLIFLKPAMISLVLSIVFITVRAINIPINNFQTLSIGIFLTFVVIIGGVFSFYKDQLKLFIKIGRLICKK